MRIPHVHLEENHYRQLISLSLPILTMGNSQKPTPSMNLGGNLCVMHATSDHRGEKKYRMLYQPLKSQKQL